MLKKRSLQCLRCARKPKPAQVPVARPESSECQPAVPAVEQTELVEKQTRINGEERPRHFSVDLGLHPARQRSTLT